MNDQNGQSRRKFIKKSLLGAIAAPAILSTATGVLGAFMPAQAEGADLSPLPNDLSTSKDPMVKALGYVHDNSKVDVAKYPKRKNPKTQDCKICQFYTPNAKHKGWGTCTLIRTGLVKDAGWCNNWVLKAKS